MFHTMVNKFDLKTVPHLMLVVQINVNKTFKTAKHKLINSQ